MRVQKPQIKKSIFGSPTHYESEKYNCQSSKMYSDKSRSGDSTFISIVLKENNWFNTVNVTLSSTERLKSPISFASRKPQTLDKLCLKCSSDGTSFNG